MPKYFVGLFSQTGLHNCTQGFFLARNPNTNLKTLEMFRGQHVLCANQPNFHEDQSTILFTIHQFINFTFQNFFLFHSHKNQAQIQMMGWHELNLIYMTIKFSIQKIPCVYLCNIYSVVPSYRSNSCSFLKLRIRA